MSDKSEIDNKTEQAPKKPAAPRKKSDCLPAFGLAEDILGASLMEGESHSPRPKPPAGPDRIFEFAEELKRSETSRLGPEKPEEQLDTWVTFLLEKEVFGLPVTHVQDILRVATITRIPHAPHPVRGVTNMRGRVLPVVDLRVRLGMIPKEVDAVSRILVVESRGHLLGLLVDAVQQVVRLVRSAIQPPPPDVMTAQSDYILGVNHLQETLVILLDLDRLLQIQESCPEA
jgi:purine-binding chemotaxis protein CheW